MMARWAVYATGPERLRELFFPAADRDRLPVDVRKYLERLGLKTTRLLRIDRLVVRRRAASDLSADRFAWESPSPSRAESRLVTPF